MISGNPVRKEAKVGKYARNRKEASVPGRKGGGKIDRTDGRF